MHSQLREKQALDDCNQTMSVPRGAVHAKWIVGKVIGTKMQKTAKVRVTRLVLDPYLLKFFNKRKTYFAHDPLQQCVVGDIVLLKALPERRSKHVKHELAEIVFKVWERWISLNCQHEVEADGMTKPKEVKVFRLNLIGKANLNNVLWGSYWY
uniref:Small ribosomal subunit protein uS17m n=1 Tax=Anser cygnoides TaxID=8845 RepID=A0A8B9IQN6_ANSCY